MDSPNLTLGQLATLACVLEVSAPKPGNVHRAADFDDMGLNDFLLSAVAIGPVYDRADDLGVGGTVLASIQATRNVVQVNTNLGINLLFAPIAVAAARAGKVTPAAIQSVLVALSPQDARDVYGAIRLAKPGGINATSESASEDSKLKNDVRGAPPDSLVEAMEQAAEWDRIAWQYANGFADVFDRIVPWLLDSQIESSLADRIVSAHLHMMSVCPDSLIARKCGQATADQSAAMAEATLACGLGTHGYYEALAELDFWLRSDGHRRNPGTTADLVAAGLFVALVSGQLQLPLDRV